MTVTIVLQLIEAIKQSFTGRLSYALILVFIIWNISYLKLSVSLELTCTKYLIVKITPTLFTYFKKYSLSKIFGLGINLNKLSYSSYIGQTHYKLRIVPQAQEGHKTTDMPNQSS